MKSPNVEEGPRKSQPRTRTRPEVTRGAKIVQSGSWRNMVELRARVRRESSSWASRSVVQKWKSLITSGPQACRAASEKRGRHRIDAPTEELERDRGRGKEEAVQVKEACVSVWMNVIVEKGEAVSKIGATAEEEARGAARGSADPPDGSVLRGETEGR